MKQKPLILVTMGDPAGVGPEIIVKAAKSGELFQICRPVVIGDAAVLQKISTDLAIPVNIRALSSLTDIPSSGEALTVMDLQLVDLSTHAWGAPDASCGSAAVAYIKKATHLALTKEADAIVTAPISKAMMNAAGYPYAGHTELLADLTRCGEYGMMFVGGGLYIILTTIHVALKDVPKYITKANVLKTLRLSHKAMSSFGIPKPRIGLAALNPHAGEGRLFGDEEWEEMMPAVLQARQEGINASDPIPADTLFYKARNNYYDIVVAMYHDQGLAPLKMLAFGNAVNVTVGLPIIRTSVDHGTAYDIAGKGCADPASLQEAVKVAVKMALFRKTSCKEGA